jgi:hypothetical protein
LRPSTGVPLRDVHAVSHHLGALSARGDHDAAAKHFEDAVAVDTAFAAPFHLACTHLEWGRCLLDAGRADPGDCERSHVMAAGDLARGAGCNQVAAHAEILL